MFWAGCSLLVRSGLLFIAAELLRRFSPRLAAKDRHRTVAVAFALLFIWPLLAAILPEVSIPISFHQPVDGIVTVRQTILLLQTTLPRPSGMSWPITLWLAGALIALLPVGIGYARIRRLIRRATVLQDTQWSALLKQECSRLRLSREPMLFISSAPVMPFTFGLWRSFILLPSDCRHWKPARRQSVLLHELAHIQRRDLPWQWLANVASALWWFQPLCWFSRSSLRRESERACDALVLQSGVLPSDYARELLEIAQAFPKAQRWSSASIAVVRRGELEGRLYAILDAAVPLPSPSSDTAAAKPMSAHALPSFTAIAALTAITVAASAVTVIPQQFSSPGGDHMKRTLLSGLLASAGLSAATIGGSVSDSNGAAISNAQASLYNPETSAKQESTTTAGGKFTFDNLAAGPYQLRIEKPGFASLYREFNVQQHSSMDRGLVLQPAASNQVANTNATPVAREAQASNPKTVRIAGEVAEEKLVRKVQPVYPASAKSEHIQGAVELNVTIAKDGTPEDLQVVSSPSDDLTESALDAVRQWRYRPTLLNGEPVQIVTDVIVNYTLSK